MTERLTHNWKQIGYTATRKSDVVMCSKCKAVETKKRVGELTDKNQMYSCIKNEAKK